MSTLEKKLYKEVTVKDSTKADQITNGKSPTYKGFSTVDPEGISNTLFDIALIKQDIINHFHIRQGEKLSDPEFGTIIWDVLFEPLTDEVRNAIASNVTRIVNFDPRVRVENINIDSYESGILVECTLVYLPYSISETMRLTFDESAGFLTE